MTTQTYINNSSDTGLIEGVRLTRICRMACCLMVLILCCAFTAYAQDSAPMSVKAKSDSTALVMGDRTTVNVEVIKNSHDGVLLTLPEKGKDYHGMELADVAVDSTDLGNGRIQLNYRFIFQAFDPNELLTLPPFVYASQGDTVASGILTFKVFPVDLSPELGDINNVDSLTVHPDATIVAVKSKWYDYIPDSLIWILVALAVIALAITLYMLYKKNGPALIKQRKPIPPYELAIMGLNKIRAKQLIEKGLAKQFYTEVTDVWRKYLEGRFGISAMEMTSRQILQHLRRNKETHLSAQTMEQMLELSDFVKFAALDPTREEMIRTYDSIYSFIESTKPAPEPEENPQNPEQLKTEQQKTEN